MEGFSSRQNLSPEAAEILKNIDMTRMSEEIPTILIDLLTGGRGDHPEAAPQARKLIPEAVEVLGSELYTEGREALIPYLYSRGDKPLRNMLAEFYDAGYESNNLDLPRGPSFDEIQRLLRSRSNYSNLMRRLLGDRYVEAMDSAPDLPIRYSPYNPYSPRATTERAWDFV